MGVEGSRERALLRQVMDRLRLIRPSFSTRVLRPLSLDVAFHRHLEVQPAVDEFRRHLHAHFKGEEPAPGGPYRFPVVLVNRSLKEGPPTHVFVGLSSMELEGHEVSFGTLHRIEELDSPFHGHEGYGLLIHIPMDTHDPTLHGRFVKKLSEKLLETRIPPAFVMVGAHVRDVPYVSVLVTYEDLDRLKEMARTVIRIAGELYRRLARERRSELV